MSKLDKFLGKGKEIEIEGEKLLLKPLTVESLGDFFKLAKVFSKLKPDDDPSEFITRLDDVSINAMKNMINETLKRSFPEETEEARKEFGMKYLMILLPAIFELNSAGGDKADVSNNIQDRIDKLNEQSTGTNQG